MAVDSTNLDQPEPSGRSCNIALRRVPVVDRNLYVEGLLLAYMAPLASILTWGWPRCFPNFSLDTMAAVN